MPTVPLIDDASASPRVRAVFDDIKTTRKTDKITDFWRALANLPDTLETVWHQVKTVMQPGKLDLLTKELIAVAVSATNGCAYCTASHTAAAQKLGLTKEGYGELLAVIALYNQTNALVDALQVAPDVFPKPW